MNKKIAAAALATALSFGTLATISTANADTGHAVGVSTKISTVLSGLVTKGTITQAQADAISAAITAATPAKPPKPMVGGMGIGGINSAAHEAVITSTLAGDKKAALITALINFETTEIDAAVTAGKMTAAQASTAKAGLSARVTAQVEKVPGAKVDGMSKGHGKGMKPKASSIKKKA